MYEKLVEQLRHMAKVYSICKNENTNEYKLSVQAADAIEELQAGEKKFLRNISALEMENENLKRARRWIPVTERLPGREWVLCKFRAKIHEVLSLRDGYWYHDPQHQYMRGFVTHWMPLPEPPKEG